MSEMKRVLDALCDSYELELFEIYEAIKNVREVLEVWSQDISSTTEQQYYDQILKALEGMK